MDMVIEFYDKDVLKNILAPLTLRPERVVFFYDKGITDMIVFAALKKCLERNVPGIRVEQYPVDVTSMNKIYKQLAFVTERCRGEECAVDLTGGSELMLLAGYKTAQKKNIPMLYTDIIRKEIINLETDTVIAKTVTLTLEDFIDAKGACFMGETHRPPASESYGAIKEMALFLFSRLAKWKQTCSFMQTVAARGLPHDLFIQSKWNIHMKNGKAVAPDLRILEKFQALGFIEGLKMQQGSFVSFCFTSLENKQYCIGYGVWLELYVYIAAAESGVFDDVKLGTMIDWNAYDNMTVAGNEIDVILMDESLPVFISCKLRDADTAALNELLIAKKRLGGWFSKGVIVTFGKEKSVQIGTQQRAKELGIEVLDAKDIMAADFSSRLVRTIREHDLVSLKWKKV